MSNCEVEPCIFVSIKYIIVKFGICVESNSVDNSCQHVFIIRILRTRTNPFWNRSSSFSVGLTRSACAIVSIVRTDNITNQQNIFQCKQLFELDRRQSHPSTGNRMAHESEHVSSSQSLLGQIRDIDIKITQNGAKT